MKDKKAKRYAQHNKIAKVSLSLSVVTLNRNGLNSINKRCNKKWDLIASYLQKYQFRFKNMHTLKLKTVYKMYSMQILS